MSGLFCALERIEKGGKKDGKKESEFWRGVFCLGGGRVLTFITERRKKEYLHTYSPVHLTMTNSTTPAQQGAGGKNNPSNPSASFQDILMNQATNGFPSSTHLHRRTPCPRGRRIPSFCETWTRDHWSTTHQLNLCLYYQLLNWGDRRWWMSDGVRCGAIEIRC
jgi:hypothetical protein